ncbi:MAG TPA: glutamate-1-semialdehyde 2,1-aminomutase [Candidatus Methylomirabilis sp.]|nr:glutamate-1-semialdehyde 2,1-aminomutase [Candidatus Methylomirabilis sp.]
MQRETSRRLFEEAQRLLPGGVDSPVRAFRAVGGDPFFVARGAGSLLTDVDGNDYLDYVCSWGPLILGHTHPAVVSALREAIERGTSYGAPTEQEVRLAGLVQEAFPSIEMLRFVSSGTEAAMSAIRAARGFTGREKVIKFEGCYHGHADSLLVKAGSGAATFGVPDSAGVPAALARGTIALPFNDLDTVRRALEAVGKEVACLILEPVVGNMGVVLPRPGFLSGLRELTARHGVLLIFDEVITGFRLALGGAQEVYRVPADLTCLGKILGGGLPVGAYGGRREIMEQVAPLGPVYQAGTLSGNPLAMTAGIATLTLLRAPGFYKSLDERAATLEEGLRAAAREARVAARVQRAASMLTAFFTDRAVWSWSDAQTADRQRYARFFRGLLEQGVYFPPAQFEAAFASAAHTAGDVAETVRAARAAFAGAAT